MFISFLWGVFGKGGFCPGGLCPGVYVRGFFVWEVFVLEPNKRFLKIFFSSLKSIEGQVDFLQFELVFLHLICSLYA